MDVTIRVEKILDAKYFTSRKDGSVFKKYSFVGKTTEQYPKTICFTCMGDDTWARLNILAGSTYQIFFNLQSREWNGQYYTEVNAYRAQCIDNSVPSTPVSLNHTGGTDFRRSRSAGTPKKAETPPPPQPKLDNAEDEDFPF